MAPRKIIGSCFTWNKTGELVHFDSAQLLENLLLFDIFILKSNRIKELPYLIDLFGFDGLKKLFNSGGLKLLFNPTFISSRTPDERAYVTNQSGQTIIKSFDFGIGRLQDLEKIVSKSMAEGLAKSSLNSKQGIKIKEGISRSLLPYDPNEGEATHAQLQNDLIYNLEMIKKTINFNIQQTKQIPFDSHAFDLNFEFIPEVGYQAITNLPAITGIEPILCRSIIESSILSHSELNLMFERMQKFQATAGLRDSDFCILDNRLKSMYTLIDPKKESSSYHRIISLAGLPDFSAFDCSNQSAIDKFLEIRASPECIEFRNWLSTADELTPEALAEMLQPLRSKLGVFANSPTGKSIRWVANTLVGLIPGGAIAGPALGALDTFLLDKILPSKGPLAFLGAQYASLYN